jgi:hypothetical protein
LNLKCDFLVSKFAFKFNLYRYIEEEEKRLQAKVALQSLFSGGSEKSGEGGMEDEPPLAA